MVVMYFSCLTPQRNYTECMFCGPDIDSCFKTLNVMVNAGWQLLTINLPESPTHPVWLPIEAFDGKSMDKSLQALQFDWEAVLANN